MNGHLPAQLTIGRVQVRRWRPGDAEALHDLVLANLEHLRPWMAWIADEPLSLQDRRDLIGSWCRRWDAGEDFSYAIVDDAGDELLGACGLHRRIDPAGLEIGYWVRGDRTGQGIATDAVRALAEAAFADDAITHLEIHHDAANVASRRVPEKVGFTRVGERPAEVRAPAECGIAIIRRRERTAAP
jgi:ribosomal-protein-serine acetyltransferase